MEVACPAESDAAACITAKKEIISSAIDYFGNETQA
jgi:hypothetical protein